MHYSLYNVKPSKNYAKKIPSQKYKNCRSFSCQQNFTSFPGANLVLMAVGFYRLLSHHILLNKDIDNVCLQTASVIFPLAGTETSQ